MRVVIAIDSFKGSASSSELALHVTKGIKKVYEKSEIVVCPVADGGEGTVEALSSSLGAKLITLTCKDPLGEDVEATYTILQDNTAVIEMASASGLPLVIEEKRDPSITSTFGTGELIVDAIKRGAREFIVGIGGSATNDAGLGMLRALGWKFLDEYKKEIVFAKDLSKIVFIDKQDVLKELEECSFKIACDVNNPLYGPNGAAYVYAKQKGADEKMIEFLDKELKAFAKIVNEDLAYVAGSGAAGGLGFGFLAFLNAKLQSGIEIVLEQVEFQSKIKNADFVITGEGKIDRQSTMGKVIDGIGKLCKEEGVPCVALAGGCSEVTDEIHECGVTSVFSVIDSPMSLKTAMDKQKVLGLVEKKVEQLFRLIKVSRR
ncbi:glycerate kinase [Sulfurospirillum arcachonense]|uniref:glycerate kinase family protein n=1 Tax=Sulfurospirillum arcachonense TaxID=57666 RepID=UPI0004692028|nr:glycerate kinase [Sulfurospirillum arcachonense]